jgi:hypothetical protein
MPKLVAYMEMDRDELQAVIDQLVVRGFVKHGTGGYAHDTPNQAGEFVYEDWWDLTDAGRDVLGVGPRVVHRPGDDARGKSE